MQVYVVCSIDKRTTLTSLASCRDQSGMNHSRDFVWTTYLLFIMRSMTIVYTSSTLISHVSDSLGRTSLNYFNWAHEKIDSWTLVELSSYARRRKFSVFDHVDTSRSQVNCVCLKFTTFCDLRELARMLNETCQTVSTGFNENDRNVVKV